MKKAFLSLPGQIFLMIFIFCDCRSQQSINSNFEEAKEAIETSNEIYFQAFARADSALFVNLYAPDCWIMQPNTPTLCGTEAPLDFFITAYNELGIRNGKFITIDIFGSGEEFVTEVGFWKSVDAKNNLIDTGKFLVLWKKTPDGWRRFRDSFNSDRIK